MAKPTVPSIGTRILYYGALPPQPTFYINQPSGAKIYNPLPSPNSPPDVAAGQVAPGLVVALGGSTPDYIGMVVSLHGPDGSVVLRQGMVNIATWTSAGSDPTKPRWDYIDLTA
jgi:hypothetical protein